METILNHLVELLAAFGIGVLVVLGAGFWVFHRVKKDAEKRDAGPDHRRDDQT
jgi:uncharacterized membrane protein